MSEKESGSPIFQGATTGIATGVISGLIFPPVAIPAALVTGIGHALVAWNKREQERLEIEKKRLQAQEKTNQVILVGLLSMAASIIVGCGFIAAGAIFAAVLRFLVSPA